MVPDVELLKKLTSISGTQKLSLPLSQDSPPLGSVLSQINPIHTLPLPNFFKKCPVVNRFTLQTLPTVNRKYFYNEYPLR